MHEVGIAGSIVDSVLREMKVRNLKSVATIALRIGALTDVDPDALSFGFEVLTKDTPLAGTRLDIQRIEIRGECGDCATGFEIKDLQFICPHCSGRNVKLINGMELDIAYLEVPDDGDGSEPTT